MNISEVLIKIKKYGVEIEKLNSSLLDHPRVAAKVSFDDSAYAEGNILYNKKDVQLAIDSIGSVIDNLSKGGGAIAWGGITSKPFNSVGSTLDTTAGILNIKEGVYSENNHKHDNSYASKSSEHTHSNKKELDGISQANISEWNNKATTQYVDDSVSTLNTVMKEVEGTSISEPTTDGEVQDLVIEGNTYQDSANLSIIKSSGDLLEDGRYKLSLLCCGKNLLDKSKSQLNKLLNADTGKLFDAANLYDTSDYIKVFSGISYCTNNNLGWYYCFYDTNKNFIKRIDFPFEPNQDGYIRVSYRKTQEDVQLEIGITRTQYEPYQEHVQDVYLPCELGRVGDVANRLLCSNDVWGVEKNNIDMILDENTPIYQSQPEDQFNSLCDRFMTDEIIEFNQSVITDKLGYNDGTYSSEGLRGIGTRVYIYINKERYGGVVGQPPSLSKFKEWLKNNNIGIKIPTKEPQFIPLADSQQIKLKTFMNHTNITSLCEIHPIIKGKIPNSIKDIISSNTNSIKTIEKDLEEVKKVEQATNTVIVTDKDFVSIENTNVGFVKSVELEGNTLNNIVKVYDWFTEPTKLSTDSTVSVSISDCPRDKFKIFNVKENTDYTVIPLIEYENSTFANNACYIQLNVLSNSATEMNAWFRVYQNEFNKPYLFNSKDLTKINSWSLFIGGFKGEITIKSVKLIILEGDHTKNPPKEHFDGLKSVGEDVEYIEVSTDNGNLFDTSELNDYIIGTDPDGTILDYFTLHSHDLFLNKFEPNTQYTFRYKCKETVGDKKPRFIFNYTDGTSSDVHYSITNTMEEYIATSFINKTVKSISVNYASTGGAWVVDLDSVMLNKGTYTDNYIPHKHDTQKVLYKDVYGVYKKPILRKWDYIKQLTDGKYKYHKLSDKKVFNNDNWIINSTFTNDTVITVQVPVANAKYKSKIICNRFNEVPIDGTNIGISFAYQNNIYLSMLKSIVGSDLSSVKTWIQNNNIEIIYQLAKEEIYECLDLNLQTFDPLTNYQVSSGLIIPTSKITLSQNIGNIVSNLVEDTSKLKTKVSEVLDVVAYEHESEDNYISVKNSKEGTFNNTKLYGNTVVNYAGGDSAATLIPTSRAKTINLVYPIPAGSTIYLGLSVIHKTNVPKGLGVQFLHDDGTYTVGVITGVYSQKLSVKTEKEVKALYFYISQADAEANEDAKLMFKDLCVTTSDVFQYFEGVKSVGDLEELKIASDNNGFNFDYSFTEVIVTDGKEVSSKKHFITNYNYLKYDYNYKLEADGVVLPINVTKRYYNRNKKYIGDKVTDDSFYVRFRFLSNGELDEKANYRLLKSDGEKMTNTYMEDKKKFLYKDDDGAWKPVILRIGDYIEELANGRCKYHRLSGEKIMTANDTFNTSSVGDMYYYGQTIPSTQSNTLNVICDKAPSILYNERQVKEGVYSSGVYIYEATKTIKTLDDYKLTLPKTIVYQLKQEEVYDCIDLSLNSFDGETSVFTNSSIPHRLSVTQKQGLKARVETLEKEIKFMYDNLDIQMVQNMMATAEVCEMVLFLHEPKEQPFRLSAANSYIIDLYCKLVNLGKYTTEQEQENDEIKLVPEYYKEQVKLSLDENN